MTLQDTLAAIRSAADSSVEDASTLPPEAYRSEELYEREVERLLRPGWIAIGRLDQVSKPGDYFSVDLLGENLVVTRAKDMSLHVLSRICRHRWMEVVSGNGNARALQCPYHLWTYGLSGKLVGAPYMDNWNRAAKARCALPSFAHAEWGGFVWVNLDGHGSDLDASLAPLTDQLQGLGLESQVLVESIDWGEQDWDWKVMIDNFMECYHHLGTHAESLNAAYPADAAWTDASTEAYSLMHVVRATGAGSDGGWPQMDPMSDEDGTLVHVFPLTIFSVRRSGTNVLRVLPLGPGRIHLYSDMLAPRSIVDRQDFAALWKARREVSDLINQEDIEACRAVQKGLGTPSVQQGHLSHLERPLWQFIRYMAVGLCS